MASDGTEVTQLTSVFAASPWAAEFPRWSLEGDKLAFDVAARYALVDDRPVTELRAGVTFAFPLNFGGATGGESSNAAMRRR